MRGKAQIGTLAYAVRPGVILKYLGEMALVLAALTTVPLLVSLVESEYRIAWRYGLVIIALLAAGLAQWKRPAPRRIQANEALALSALIFLLAPLIMTVPLQASGLSWIDALFEAVSATTTTGLSVIDAPETMPRTFLFGRAWMQWYGGLGIIVLSIALVVGHGSAARRLVDPEHVGERLPTTARLHARRMGQVYLLVTALGFLLVLLTTPDLFMAVTFTLAAISTGGFAPATASLGELSRWGAWAVTLLTFVGAVALPIYYAVYLRGLAIVRRNPELPVLILLCLLTGGAVAAVLWQAGVPSADALHHGLLLGFSAQTTSGFASLNPADLGPGILLLLIPAMLIGGSAASTAGGVKVFRFLILLRVALLSLRRTAMPTHAVVHPRLAGRALDSDEIERALLIILLFLGLIFCSWLLFVLAGHPPLPALFEVVSATGTVGLSAGITGSELSAGLKLLLCLNMVAGRVEIFALLVLLIPGTWAGKRMEA